MSRSRLVVLGLVGAATMLSGSCGIEDPYADGTPDSQQAAPGREAAAAADDAPGATAPTPAEAVRRVALAYGNWTGDGERSLRRAAAISIGRARRQLRRQAAQRGTDLAVAGGTLRSSATVEVVSVRGSGDRRRALVVTREGMEGGGIEGEGHWYTVTLATIDRVGDRWAISRWEPQP